jgi:hypothetical protein
MQSILQQSQSNPKALQDHMKNPMIKAKIQKVSLRRQATLGTLRLIEIICFPHPSSSQPVSSELGNCNAQVTRHDNYVYAYFQSVHQQWNDHTNNLDSDVTSS